jgi:hypothetical protein
MDGRVGYKNYDQKRPKGRDILEDLDIDGIILELILKA